MKSMLHEAPTIEKAIEQAWNNAGKPTEFTVKILDSGEKKLFWFAKRPAIVSITYDPQKQTMTTNTTTIKQEHHNSSSNRRSAANNKQKNAHTIKKQEKKTSHSNQPQKSTSQQTTSPAHKQKQSVAQQSKQKNTASSSYEAAAENATWNTESIQFVQDRLDEIISIIGITNKYVAKSDKRALQITFSEKIFTSSEEERMLFISLSYLLMQFLKKNYKRKFRGFQILLTSSKTSGNHDKKQSGTAE